MIEPELDLRRLGTELEHLRIRLHSPADRSDALLQLRRIIELFPGAPEAAQASDMIVAATPSSRENPVQVADLNESWINLSGPGHRNAAATIRTIFDPALPEGPRTNQLRSRVLRTLTGFLAELEGSAGLKTATRASTADHLRGLTAELARAIQLPGYAAFAPDVERLTEFAARREATEAEAAFIAAEAKVAAALERWDIDAARAAWSTMPKHVPGYEARRSALESQIAEAARLAHDVEAAIGSLAARTVAQAQDLAPLTAALAQTDALLAEHAVPPEIAAQAETAANAARTAALAWAERAAGRITDLTGLAKFATDQARLPKQWQGQVGRSWFDRAWSTVLADLRQDIERSADAPALAEQIRDWTQRLEAAPPPLRAEAKAVTDALQSLETAWFAAAAGNLLALPTLDVLGSAAFLPSAYRQQHDQLRRFTEACRALRERIAGINETAPEDAIDGVRDEVDKLEKSFPHLSDRLGALRVGLAQRVSARAASAALRTLDVRSIVQQAALPGADRRLAALKGRGTALQRVASLARERPADPAAQIAGLLNWITALRDLGNPEDLPAVLEDKVQAITGERLTSLVAGCEAVLKAASSATELHGLAEHLGRLPWFGQVRALRRQFLRKALDADFNVAAAAKDLSALDRIIQDLRGFEDDPDAIAALELRVRLLRLPSAAERSAAIIAEWFDIVRLLPDQIAALALEAARHENALDTMSPHRLAVREHIAAAIGAARSAEDKAELLLWSEWTEIETGLDRRPDSNTLARCSEFWLARRRTPFGRFIEAGMAKFIRAWHDRKQQLALCWASRLFPGVYRGFSRNDPVAELDGANVHLAEATRALIRATPDLLADLLRDQEASLEAALHDWAALTSALENGGVWLEGFKGPDELTGGANAVRDLASAVHELAGLLNEDFSDPATAATMEACRFRLLGLNDRYGPMAAFPMLRDQLGRIYQACEVRGPWEDFVEICRRDWMSDMAQGGLRSTSGLRSLEDATHSAQQIDSVLQSSGMATSCCADGLARRAASLSKWGPIDVPQEPPKWNSVVKSINGYLDEFRHHRSLISAIEGDLPPGGISRPDDPQHAEIWRRFPASPPRGTASLLLWKEAMQRDAMAATYHNGANRFRNWLVGLATS